MHRELIFVSYRRSDSGPIALALRPELELRLDGIPVFVDLNRINAATDFPEVLDDALKKAKVMLILIGADWTGLQPNGERRISDPSDWVSKEVKRGLDHPSGAVLPILLNGAQMPPRGSLPSSLHKLCDLQALPLRFTSWDADLKEICAFLAGRFDMRVSDELLPPPSPIKRHIDKVSDESLKALYRDGHLTGWAIETVYDYKASGAVREFLKKAFTFRTDAHAFHFIHRIKPLTKKRNHHPIIEAKYSNVLIRLSTFDAGHYITSHDVNMAVDIDRIAKKFKPIKTS